MVYKEIIISLMLCIWNHLSLHSCHSTVQNNDDDEEGEEEDEMDDNDDVSKSYH